MSKYTETEINDAIKIVQAALEDREIECRAAPAQVWYKTGEVCAEYDYRAAKVRDYWLVLDQDAKEGLGPIYAYDYDPTEEFYGGTDIVHVKEVLK